MRELRRYQRLFVGSSYGMEPGNVSGSIFEIRDSEEGDFFARASGQAIFTEAETWDELRTNVEAVAPHLGGGDKFAGQHRDIGEAVDKTQLRAGGDEWYSRASSFVC